MLETTLCYITLGSNVLLLHRVSKSEDVNAGKWIGVGGKLEAGETPEACVLREVKEETGLTLTRYEYRGIVDFRSEGWKERMHLFTADAFSGELLGCDEGRLAWIGKEEMDKLPMWEGDHIFFRLLNTEAPFFHLLLCYDGEKLTEARLNGAKLAV